MEDYQKQIKREKRKQSIYLALITIQIPITVILMIWVYNVLVVMKNVVY